jgi:hypothetical protein
LKLLLEVAGILRQADIPFALIGAGAMAAHGVSRATADLDLLAVEQRCLDRVLWDPLAEAGVVRFETADEGAMVDLVAGWGGRQVAAAGAG